MSAAERRAYEVELSWTRIEAYEVVAATEDDAITSAIVEARKWDDAPDTVEVEAVTEVEA